MSLLLSTGKYVLAQMALAKKKSALVLVCGCDSVSSALVAVSPSYDSTKPNLLKIAPLLLLLLLRYSLVLPVNDTPKTISHTLLWPSAASNHCLCMHAR